MPSRAESRLFKPLRVGNMHLQNRLVMAPLTRFRAADPEHVPIQPIVTRYYEQRASIPGTLLISEATIVSPQASGYGNSPGIWTDAQIASWKTVTDAVHAKGSFILCQLWFMGRAASADYMKSVGLDVVSASNIPISSDSPVPRPLTEAEIERTIGEFAQGAKNAIAAGFDGVEIHGANGYLVDQFLQTNSNDRTDKWGGSVENRARLGLEVTKAVVAAIGAERTGIRLSPWSEFQSMRMPDPVPTFTHIIKELRALDIAFLHIIESRINSEVDPPVLSTDNDVFLDAWNNAAEEKKPVFIAGGFKPDLALELVDKQRPTEDVAVVFGRWWIANPDLVFRIKEDLELTPYDRSTFYAAKQSKGYDDYEFHPKFLAQAKA